MSSFAIAVISLMLFSARPSQPGTAESACGIVQDQTGAFVHRAISLRLEAVAEQVTVAEGSADVSSLNVAQTQVSSGLLRNLPSESVNAALSSILTLTTPGVASDSNGVFHPLGEHAETSFSIDGQPISDQQSRIFSNQISASAI